MGVEKGGIEFSQVQGGMGWGECKNSLFCLEFIFYFIWENGNKLVQSLRSVEIVYYQVVLLYYRGVVDGFLEFYIVLYISFVRKKEIFYFRKSRKVEISVFFRDFF